MKLLTCPTNGPRNIEEFESFGPVRSEPDPATTADAEGRFALAVSDDTAFHYVIASAEGHGVAVKPAVAAGADVVLALPRAIALVGTVTDRDGKPVVGARVRVLLLFDAMKVEREAMSGEGGAYRVADVPPTGDWPASRGFAAYAWVEVVADGYAPAFVYTPPLQPSAAEERLDLVLSRGITVHGNVVDDETDTPIEGATVDLQSTEGGLIQDWVRRVSLSTPYAPRSLARCTTGADGGYRFEHVPGALEHEQTRPVGDARASPPRLPTVVLAWKSGFAPQGARVERAAQSATSREIVLRLRRAGAVSGRVVEADGTPVEGATVVAEVEGYEVRESSPPSLLPPDAPRAKGTTGTDGRFLLTGVAGRASGGAVAVVETYQPILAGAVAGTFARRFARAEARVDVGRTTDVGDLQFPALVLGPTRRVRVLDAQGRPVWGAKIVDPVEVARTDRAGEAVWSEVRPRIVGVRAAGFAPASIAASAWESEGQTVEVRLEPGRRVSGRVLRADRTPAAGATVAVARNSLPVAEVALDRESARGRSSDGSPMRPGFLATATAGEDGAFEFVDLVAGPWHLGASVAKRVGMGPDALLRTVVADVASDATGVELVLPTDDSPATGRLEGRVVGSTEGEALGGLWITVRRGDETVGSAVKYDPDDVGRESGPGVLIVKPDGRFAFDVVPVGSLSLEVKARGWLPQRVDGVEVRVGATTTAPPIVMRRGAVVRGMLRAPGVTSWIGRHLSLRPAGGGASHTVAVAEDGTYRVTGLSPGTYLADVPAGGPSGRRDPPLLARGAGTVVVSGESGEIAFDVDLVQAGMITIKPSDPRLPPPPYDSLQPTEAQAKFGAETRVRVTANGGAVVLDRTGAFQGGLYAPAGAIGGSNPMTLLPGRYVARIDYPGGESMEETVVLEPGPTVFVSFRRR